MLESAGLVERRCSAAVLVLAAVLWHAVPQPAAAAPPGSGAHVQPAAAPAGTAYLNYSADRLGLTCQAYMVYDLDGGQPVALYNLERRQPIASLTKLMTAILAEERLRFDGSYRLTAAEQKTFKVETLRVDKLLELALIPSNNAACKVIARLVSGSEPQFAELMNKRARELGLQHTQFVNASGLPQDGQSSCLYDVALLGRYAMSYPHISAAMCQPSVELAGTVYKGTLRDLYARHASSASGRLLGGKTGYTKAAGRCLCLLYESGGHKYLVVTLGSSGIKSSFKDVEQLLSVCGLYRGPVGEWK
jgi:D-alanyl-D-alanine carboxypeptidase (penicillin-binding protein 5/6)